MQRPQLEHIIRAAAAITGAEGIVIIGSQAVLGQYAHGVAEETAILPAGWKERLIVVRNANTGQGWGLCLEVHDLAVAKLAAGRERDFSFVASLLRSHLAGATLIESRLRQSPLSGERLDLVLARLQRLAVVR